MNAGTATDSSLMCSNDQGSMEIEEIHPSRKTKRSVRNYYNDEDSDDDFSSYQRRRRMEQQFQSPNSIVEAKPSHSIIMENFVEKFLSQQIEHIESNKIKDLKEHNEALILSHKRCESEIDITKYNAETNRLLIMKDIRNAEAEILRQKNISPKVIIQKVPKIIIKKEKSWCVIQ
jgi:hypothetical protein